MLKCHLATISGTDRKNFCRLLKNMVKRTGRTDLFNKNLTEEQCVYIVRNIPKGLRERRVPLDVEKVIKDIHERFIQEERDGFFIPGTADYVEAFEKERPKCCNTCAYLRRRTTKTTKKYFGAYCSLHRFFVSRYVYKDWCNCYTDDFDPRPKKWAKKDAPKNLDIYGEIDNTILGIEPFNFTDKTSNEVNLIWEVEYDR